MNEEMLIKNQDQLQISFMNLSDEFSQLRFNCAESLDYGKKLCQEFQTVIKTVQKVSSTNVLLVEEVLRLQQKVKELEDWKKKNI